MPAQSQRSQQAGPGGGIVGSVLVLACAVVATPVFAHAGVEELAGVARSPVDPDVVVLRYSTASEGLAYSVDGGRSFELLCGAAIGSFGAPTAFAIAGDGSVALATVEGLAMDDRGTGCGFALDPSLPPGPIADVTPDPADPGVLFAVTGAEGDGVENHLLRGVPGKWTELGAPDVRQRTSVRVARGPEGLRIYETLVSGFRVTLVDGVEEQIPDCTLRVSSDEGASWQEHPCPTAPGAPRLLAVDPTNPDRLLFGTLTHGAGDIVWLSDDAGASFTVYAELTELGGVALTETGGVYLGDAGNGSDPGAPRGLSFAASLGDAPSQLADYSVRCLDYDAGSGVLWGCQRWWFGAIDTASGEFDTRFSIDSAMAQVRCDDQDVAAVCEESLCSGICRKGTFAAAPACDVYQRDDCGPCSSPDTMDACTLGVAEEADPLPPAAPSEPVAAPASIGDAAPAMAAAALEPASERPQARSGDAGGGCRAAGPGEPPGPGAALPCLVALWLARRRRRRRS